MRSITNYRGYSIVTDESQGYAEVYVDGVALERADSVQAAQQIIDDWLYAA